MTVPPSRNAAIRPADDGACPKAGADNTSASTPTRPMIGCHMALLPCLRSATAQDCSRSCLGIMHEFEFQPAGPTPPPDQDGFDSAGLHRHPPGLSSGALTAHNH